MDSVLVLAYYHLISDIVRTKTHAFNLAWVFFCLCSWSDLCCSRMIVRFGAWHQLRPLPGANYCSVSERFFPGRCRDFSLVDPLAASFNELLFGLSDCRTVGLRCSESECQAMLLQLPGRPAPLERTI